MSPRKTRDGPRLPRRERTPGAFRCISVFCQNNVSREKRPQGRIGFFVKDIKLIFVTSGVLKYFRRTRKPPACSGPSLRARLRTGRPTSTRPSGRAWPRARRWRARASGAECRGWAGPGSSTRTTSPLCPATPALTAGPAAAEAGSRRSWP